MRIFIIITVFYLVGILTSYSQSRFSLELLNVDTVGEELHVKIKINNVGTDFTRVYLPVEKDICYGLLSISFISSLRTSQLIPCSEIIDLDSMEVTCSNSTILNRGDSYNRSLIFKLSDISPYLQKGIDYEVKAILNYGEVNFINKEPETTLTQSLYSNSISFTF